MSPQGNGLDFALDPTQPWAAMRLSEPLSPPSPSREASSCLSLVSLTAGPTDSPPASAEVPAERGFAMSWDLLLSDLKLGVASEMRL